jgi:hypothetical protein
MSLYFVAQAICCICAYFKMALSGDFEMPRGLFNRSVGFVLAFGIVSGALADSVNFFNPDPGAPVSVYNTGMSIVIS